MRIAFFSDTYLPYASGAVRSMELFARELKRRRHEVYVFAPNYPGYFHDDAYVVRVPSLPVLAYPGLRLGVPHPFMADEVDVPMDLVHTHSPFTMGQAGVAFARLRNVPLVCTIHSLYEDYLAYYNITTKVFRQAVRRFTVAYCNQVQRVLAPSGYVKDQLEACGVQVPIDVLATGVELELYPSADPEWPYTYFNLPRGRKLLLSAGRLAPEKSINLLLQAVALLVRRGSNVHFLVVGAGPEEARLRTMVADLGLRDRVTLGGLLPKERLIDCYTAADLFMFASTIETQGLVVLEAMAAGLPAVAVDSPAIRETMGDCNAGFLTGKNARDLAEAAARILEDPDLARLMGERGRARAELFSIQKCTQALERIYADVLAVWHA